MQCLDRVDEAGLGAAMWRAGHHLQLLEGSVEFFPAVVAAIEGATAEVRLETYIFDFTGSGAEVAYALERAARRFQVLAAIIAGEEGFELNTRKSRFMRQGVCQHVAGVVVNVRPNVHRESYDLLKATLWNCLRHGPGSQNRDRHADFRAHLLGRIAHVTLLHAERGGRLRELFDRIVW